ncbi:hypothetical protein COCOBI_07-6180 [Coccomyxa sp. Obi]|nr:hypothetical protein COCOBI_07-6180 [Coccomyxa sp. Obi]
MGASVRSGGRQADSFAGPLWSSFCKEAEALKWKDALRVGIGVVIFAIASVIFDYQDRLENGRRDLHQWSQGCLWGAITMITVNAPVLGKIAKTCFERCLGTVVGGWLGCACFLINRHPAWTAGISFLIVAVSSMLAVKLKLDMSCKLLSITFILVLWTPQSDAQAVLVAASRVSCIVLSVLLMGLLAMLIYPQCASEQVLGSLHKAMDSAALLNRIVWEEVINKCKEESFRISMSFKLAHKATGTVLGGSQEDAGTVESSRLACAGPKQQPGAVSLAVAASPRPEAAPLCITDMALEGEHLTQTCHVEPPSTDMPASEEKQLLGPDSVADGIAETPRARHSELQGSTNGAAPSTKEVLPGLATFACARQPTDPCTSSTSAADVASPVSASISGSNANIGSSALSRIGTAFRAHEARCRAAADAALAADPRSTSAAEEDFSTPQLAASNSCAGSAAAAISGSNNAANGFCAPQPGVIRDLTAPASGRGLHVPQPGAAHSGGNSTGDILTASQGNGHHAPRECTGKESPVKGAFASKQSLPARAPSKEGEHAPSEKTLSTGEVAAAKAQSRWHCLPVCCPLPPRVSKGGVNANEETEAKRQLDAEEEAAAERLALQLGFKGYAELEREEPFFDASTAVRNQQAAAEEQLTTALSEMYVGTWAGRRWYLPTVFYQNEARGKKSWHMPEKIMNRLAMRMRRVVRILNMIHATFRDGFQNEVLEELQHHFPLDLLVELSEAAIDTLQAFVDAFPQPHQPVTALMADTQVQQLRKVMDAMLALARTSRQHKVELILLGEEIRKSVAAGCCTNEAELLRRLRASWAAGGPLDRTPDGEEIFLFPNTEAGWLATARWYSFHFLVQQLVEALCRLRVTLNLMLPHLPGAHIAPDPNCQGDVSSTSGKIAEHRRAENGSTMHVVIEG